MSTANDTYGEPSGSAGIEEIAKEHVPVAALVVVFLFTQTLTLPGSDEMSAVTTLVI